MFNNMPYNLAIEVNDHSHGNGVRESENNRNEHVVIESVHKVVETTRSQEAFRDESAPYFEQRQDSPRQGVHPDEYDHHQSFGFR